MRPEPTGRPALDPHGVPWPRDAAWRHALGAILLLAAAGGLGCEKAKHFAVVPNSPPIARITHAPRDTTVGCRTDVNTRCYRVTLQWTGYDLDGSVAYFRYAVDPPSGANADTAWVPTTANQVELKLEAPDPIPPQGLEPRRARGYHVVVVEAVDDRGLAGPPDWRAFFSYTEAPYVFITAPAPTTLIATRIGPTLRVSWQGRDDDGTRSTQPVKYKYALLSNASEITPVRAVRSPDSLLARYGPSFSEWDSVGGDTTSLEFSDLTSQQEYLFVVVAIDEAGAYSPVFRLDTNMLWVKVGIFARLGPKLTVSSESFSFTWRGDYCLCPATIMTTQLPEGIPLHLQWSAEGQSGAQVRTYRWALDILDLEDEAPRSDENTDLAHWSFASFRTRTATVPAFQVHGESEDHLLYVEALDDFGFKSLAIVRLHVLKKAFRPGSLLIVKDTRLRLDQLNRTTGCVNRPQGLWPTQAELDTFLFARGGAPWKCYPAGTRTTAGLFAAYRFDTIGTFKRSTSLGIPLATLLEYEHVLWIVDPVAAGYTSTGIDFDKPMTAIRYMTGEQHGKALEWYIALGGKVWVVGGGGMATTGNWDDAANNNPNLAFAEGNELRPGRFMYDVAHWRSDFWITTTVVSLRRNAGRHEVRPDPELPYTAALNELPSRMDFRSSGSDPLPPQRSTSEFYPASIVVEYLHRRNAILELAHPGDSVRVSTLDTLFEATGFSLPHEATDHNVVMTYYHGPAVPQGFLISGFDLWTFRSADCRRLVDFVLRRIWNIGRVSGAAPSVSPPSPESRGGRSGKPRPTRGSGPQSSRSLRSSS